MSEISFLRKPNGCRQRQYGAAAIEFALVVALFFMLVFAVIEMARLMFLYNTLQEVTRRAAVSAANADFSKSAEMDKVRSNAIFQDATGESLPLMDSITDVAIRIDYMAVERVGGTMKLAEILPGSLPSSPGENRRVCLVDPYSPSCIRVVRVRVCDPYTSSECDNIQFQSLIPLFSFSIPLPIAPTFVKAQSLGL